jgi:hypothetical protein
MYSADTLKWGALVMSSLTVLGSIGNLFCRGSEEGTCGTVNVYGVWFTAIIAMISSIIIITRPAEMAYSGIIRYGLPTLAFLTALFLTANAGASLGEDGGAATPLVISWGGAILAIITLLTVSYDSFKFGIAPTGFGYSTPVGL